MPSDREHTSPGSDRWDRVADELRACRESQQRTWGDVDNATIGRYLAGEMTADEQAQVESALEQRPELRKLTDLVRDVLGELEPIAADPPAPQPVKKARPVFDFLRRRASLLAAACLLIILGVAMPRPGFLPEPRSDLVVPLQQGMAALRVVPEVAPLGQAELNAVPVPAAAMAMAANDRGAPVAQVRLGAMAENAALQMARGLTAEQAFSLQRAGNDRREKGDYVAAETMLNQSYSFFRNRLGDEHQKTKVSACQLADVYAWGLNTAAAGASRTMVARSSASRTAGDQGEQMSRRLAEQPVREIQANVVPVLTTALKNAPGAEQRRTYVRALGQLGPAARPALPVLTARLEHSTDRAEVCEVLLTLEQMGEAARPALPALHKVCKRPSRHRGTTRAKAAPPSEQALAQRVVHRLEGCEGRVGVRDEAGCFTLGVLREACRHLGRLAHTAGIEVLIETGHPDPAKAAAALARLGARAVYVGIDPTGTVVQVKLSKELQQDGVDVTQLRQAFLAGCRQHRFDQALRAGVEQLETLAPAKKMK